MRMENCHCKAWMDTISRGYENGRPDFSDARNVRARTCPFHPSAVLRNSKGKHELKIGTSPAMCLTKFSMENDNFKEEKKLPRILGSTEETQHAHDYENKKNETLNDKTSAMVTPTRDSRNDKRNLSYLN